MNLDNIQSAKLCAAVASTPKVSNATVRVAAWLVGTLYILGVESVELSYRQIKEGFERQGKTVAGTGCRTETIKTALEWLEANKYIRISKGSVIGFGHHSHTYTMTL